MESLQVNYKHKKVAEFIGSPSGKVILSVGGGQCRIMRSLPKDNKFYSIEKNETIIPKVDGIKFIIQDAQERFPFGDDSIDVCIFSEVLEHLNEPERTIKEMYRCCKEVIITTPNNTILRRILFKLIGKSDLVGKNHVKEYGWREVKHMFEKHGFVLKDFKGICLLSMKVEIDRFPRLSAKMLMRFVKESEKK